MNGTKRSVKKWIAMLLCFCIVISGINTEGFSGIFHSDGTVAHAASNYIYFDNGLAGYDKIEYSMDEGANWKEMECLASIDFGDDRYIRHDKVNPAYIYVTQEEVTGGTIRFRGTDSGRVYDTASNYQLSSASREWGYDYKDFVWTSDAIAADGKWNCYYAPALAMQYKYNSPDASEVFIYNVGWALKNDDPDYYVKLTDTLNYAVSGILMPLTFADTVNAVTYTVNGSEAAPISFAKKSWTFTPDSTLYQTAPSSIDFTAQYAGTGDMIQFTTNAEAEVKVYADAEVTVMEDGTGTSVGTPVTYQDAEGNTLCEITATAEAGSSYTISSTDGATVYSVQVGGSALESMTTASMTYTEDFVLKHDSNTEFTLPADTQLTFDATSGACTGIVLPAGRSLHLNTTATGQSKVSVTGGGIVMVTDKRTAQEVSVNTNTDRYKLEKGEYDITATDQITEVDVGYKGTVFEPKTGTFRLESKKLEDYKGEHSSNVTIGDFTITAASGKSVKIESGSKTSNAGTLNYSINTGGAGSKENRSIKFHVDGSGKVIVYALSGSASQVRAIQLYNADYQPVGDLQNLSLNR